MSNLFRHSALSLAAASLLAALAWTSPVQAQNTGSAAASASQRTAKTTPAKPAATSAQSRKTRKAATGKAAAPSQAGAAPAAAPAAARAPARPAERGADYIVAVVNSEPVTNHELQTALWRVQRQAREDKATLPQGEALRKEVLEELISERAQLQYAEEIGLKVDAAGLQQAELSVARQNGLDSVDDLHKRLVQEGLSVSEFQDDMRRQVLLARLREREIEPRVRVTDADVDAFIRQQTGGAPVKTSLNLAMILVAVPEGASADEVARLQARANEAAQRIRGGEDFAQVAAQYSDANQRGRDGGVLGLLPAEQYPELFVRSTQRARVGEVVGPVRSEVGFHLLKVVDRQQTQNLPEVVVPETRVQHILLAADNAQARQIALERAADLRRRIQSGQASFEDVARQHSQDGSAAEGGDLGWVPPGQFVPEFEQAMNSLRVGEISQPVPTRFGVHLIRVQQRREQALSADQQRQLARNMLREQKTQEAFDTWAQEVRGRAYVEYRDPPR